MKIKNKRFIILIIIVFIFFLMFKQKKNILTMNYYVNDSLDFIKQNEQFRSKAYWDNIGKVWTVGYGETNGVTKDTIYTQAYALQKLKQKVLFYLDLLPSSLTVNQAVALVDFIYSRGIGAYDKNFKEIVKNNSNDYKIPDIFLKFKYGANGIESKGVINRSKIQHDKYIS